MRISDWSSDVCSSDLVDTFAEVSASWLSGVPTATQAIVTDFMNEGLFSTHIRQMRRASKARPDALLEAAAGLSGRITLPPPPRGFPTVRLPTAPPHPPALLPPPRAKGTLTAP